MLNLTFRELEACPRTSLPVFFTLFDASVPPDETGLFQGFTIFRIGQYESPRNPMTDGPGLPADTASANRHPYIILVHGIGQHEGLLQQCLGRIHFKIVFHRALVDGDFSRSGLQPCSGCCGLASSCSIESIICFHSSLCLVLRLITGLKMQRRVMLFTFRISGLIFDSARRDPRPYSTLAILNDDLDHQRFRVLGLVRMFTTGINLEFSKHPSPEFILWQHSLYGMADQLFRVFLQ